MIETAAPAAGRASLAARAWARPLAWHVLALAAVLVVGLFLIGPHVAYSSDEGAAVLQARMLRSGEGWHYRYPLAAIDREDQARPFVRGDLGTNGISPYAKHPLYPIVLAGLDLVGGTWGIFLGGVAGTLLAALFAALISRRLDPRLDRVVLWVVGAASPLFFDGYVVLAHTMAAAAVAAGILLAVVALGPRQPPPRRLAITIGAAICLTVASMLRTEALFVGVALALACAVLAGLGRMPRRRAAVVAIAGVGASGAAWMIDRWAAGAILGRQAPGVPNAAPSSWLAGRWQSFHTTWLQPSYIGSRNSDLVLELGAVLLVVAALLLHGRRDRQSWVVVAIIGAAACYVARLVGGPVDSIPGLALAFPAGWFLLWASGRRVLSGVAAPVLAGTAAAVTAVVLVTQYAIGGGVEWGGRYFAVVVPIAIPALVFAAAPVIRRHRPDLVRIVVVALVVMSVAASLTAVRTLRDVHQATAAVLDGIRTQAAIAGTSGGHHRPVVVSTNRLLPQIGYRDFDRYDWVVPNSDGLRRYTDRLAGTGVDRIVLVSGDQAAEVAELPGWRVVSSQPGLALDVAVLEHSG